MLALTRSLGRLGLAGPSLASSGVSASVSQVRWGHRFMKSNTAKQMWDSSTGMSNKSRMGGRQRRRRYDLNRGQRLGQGLNYNLHFPGLASEPYSELRQPTSTLQRAVNVSGDKAAAATVPSFKPRDPKRWEALMEVRRLFKRAKRPSKKQTPLERGYSGTRMPGKKLTEDLPEELRLQGFQAVCLEQKVVARGTAKGHHRRFSTLVAVGNGQGMIGVAVGKNLQARSATKTALTKACRRLEFMERLEERTVYQDFYAEAAGARLFCQRAREGAGITGHRILRDLCVLVGLSDVKIGLRGTTNPQMMVKALMTGLRHQETHAQLAARSGLHVVEMRKESGFMPKVVASPEAGKLRTEVAPDEPLDLDELYGQGRIPYAQMQPKPFFLGMSTFIHARWLEWPFRNHEALKVRYLAEGRVPSWNWRHRHLWSRRLQADVVDGKALLPQPMLGLPPFQRKSLDDDE